MSTESSNSVTLAPPGAGLPWIELQVARLLFTAKKAFSTRTSSNKLLRSETDSILEIIATHETERLRKQVLIKRLSGLEDSSRQWSVYMTLAHLHLVNGTIAEVIGELSAGRAPDFVASTASVKPSANIGPEILPFFVNSSEKVLRSAAESRSLSTAARFEHPWFGSLDAAGWLFLAGFHIGLHRRQILTILQNS